MNLLLPDELAHSYCATGQAKIQYPFYKTVLLAVFAGIMIALGGAVANTAAFSLGSASASRIAAGLLFPFGLGIIIMIGGELFTGSCLIVISALDGKVRLGAMLRNWLIVYAANFLGALLVAAACAFFGQFDVQGGALAAYAIKLAAAKCSLPFANAFVLGILCNICVCLGVLVSLAAKDAAGRILGAFIPVAFFVICGFEHSVANMFSIPAGLFAASLPKYAGLLGSFDASALSWGNFLAHNLLPVTLGNIVGGCAIGALMWSCYLKKRKEG